MPIEKQHRRAVGSNRQSAIGSRQLIDVSAGLIFRSGKVLITRRNADSHLGGLWEFPGGKRRTAETFKQCLVRELREELGVEVSVGGLMDEIIHIYPAKTVRVKFFVCRLKKGDPRPLCCAAVKWVNQGELAQYEFPAADAKLLGKLRANPKFFGSPTKASRKIPQSPA